MAETTPHLWPSYAWHHICPECGALLAADQTLTDLHMERCRRLTVVLDAHWVEHHPAASGSVPTSPGDRPAMPPIGTEGHYDRSGSCAWGRACSAHW